MKHWLRKDYNFTKNDWYKPYELLNNMQMQTGVLKTIQIDSIKSHNSRLSAEINYLNSFLKKFQDFAMGQIKSDDSEADFFSIFLKKINEGYGFFDKSDKNSPEEVISKFNEYLNSIEKLANVLANCPKNIPEETFHNIKEKIHNIKRNIEALIQNGDKQEFKKQKAQLWEDISVWILQMAGFEAIGTGAIVDKAGKQLIQDTIAWLPNQLQNKSDNLPKEGLGVSLRYTGIETKFGNKELADWAQREIVNKGKARSAPLGRRGYVNCTVDSDIQGFNNLMEDVSQHSLKKKITVKLDDPTQKYLSNFLSVQAKSGSGQALLNNQSRDWIDIATLGAWDEYLKILNEFYNNFSNNKKVSTGSSDNLAAYTNWVFSTNIAKSTLGKNTFFFSEHGFATLDMAMDKDKFYFKLAPNPNSLKLLSSTSFSIVETKD